MLATTTSSPGSVRPASAAGLYYPKDADALRRVLTTLLARPRPDVARLPKALVVPHSGYSFSGAVAAAAYRTLQPRGDAIRHVVLVGPSHRVPMRGLAMPSCQYYSTPFGPVPVDDSARQRLRELGLAGVADAPHALEHSLEVQVPFLQELLREFDLLPIAVGSAPPEQVARALDAVWGGPETLVIVTSDLSHHRTHAEALLLDGQTAASILARRSDVSDAQACGAGGVNGLMEIARRKSLEVTLLERGTSGDTAGDCSRVVGFASFMLHEPGH
jgi:AmmeMemoRadiSam system protein B